LLHLLKNTFAHVVKFFVVQNKVNDVLFHGFKDEASCHNGLLYVYLNIAGYDLIVSFYKELWSDHT
jgi:hypothetical protein